MVLQLYSMCSQKYGPMFRISFTVAHILRKKEMMILIVTWLISFKMNVAVFRKLNLQDVEAEMHINLN